MMDYLVKETLILGCGNILFGDDGFGPEVVKYLQDHFEIPSDVCLINAGLSVRDLLFTITLSDTKPKRIIIVDAVDIGRRPGDTFELDLSELPETKIDDFSMHQIPTSNLLKELKIFCGIDIFIISTQIQNIPKEVSPGLSQAVQDSIPRACDKILERIP